MVPPFIISNRFILGEWRLFARHDDGSETWLEKVDETTMIQHTVYNPDAQIEINRQRQNMFNKMDKKAPLTLVAEVPEDLYWDLHRKGIVQDRKAYRRWLDDSDNRAWRTNDMTLGRKSK